MIANPNITATQDVKPADGETLLWACDQRDPRTLGPGLLNDARNLRFADGLPTTRKGVVKPAWANKTSAGGTNIGSLGTPYGAGVFRDPNGVEWMMIAAGGFVWQTRPNNAAVQVPLPPGVAIVSNVRFVQAFNLLFLFRGQYLAPLVLSDLGVGFTDLLPQFNATTGGSLGGGVYQAAVVAQGIAADEMSYGPYIAVSSLTWANGIATCATTNPHGFITGSDVTVAGAAPTCFNGRVGITVLDQYTFTYPVYTNTGNAATATGTITVSNNAYYWQAAGSQVTLKSLALNTSQSFILTSLTCPAAFTPTSLTCPNTFTITELQNSNRLVTVTAAGHGLASSESVTIAGVTSHKVFDCTATVVTVVDANHFTYTIPGSGTLPNVTVTDSTMVGTAPYGPKALVTYANHGLTSGAAVTVAGANQSAYNVSAAVVTVINSSSFTYAMASNPNANATGTITVTPSNYLTATATKAGHGLTTGQAVTISGATPSGYNATNVAVTVLSTSQFTYPLASGVTSPATGTITVATYVSGGLGALATTPAAHGFLTGDTVTISGATPAAYNGSFVISVPTPTTFTYLMGSAPGGTAAGTITAQTSRVLAGQTPDTNPNAWTRAYNILPNADTALFVQNLLLVPTAYQPSSVNNYSSISGGAYTTKDFLVATNYQDYIHFLFTDEFRLNEGTADAIVDLFQFGQGNVVVLKSKSYWMITGLNSGSIANVSAQQMSNQYGAASLGSACVVGANAYFLSPSYGVVVIRTTDLGTILSVDVPLSAPIQPTIDQVDWTQASTFRMSHWDNKLYLAVALKNGQRVICVYDFKASVRMGNNVWESGVMTQGWTPVDTGAALAVQDFMRLTFNGQERHFFLDRSGYVNLLEESDTLGDQVVGSGPQGLAWAPIDSYGLSRAYGTSLQGQLRPVEVCVSLATLNPCYTLSLVFPGAANTLTLASGITRSNTLYDRPFNAPAWNPTNVNGDWATPWRQDYSVSLVTGGVSLANGGVQVDALQEMLDTRGSGEQVNKSFQLAIESTTGQIKIVGLRISDVPARNRRGIRT